MRDEVRRLGAAARRCIRALNTWAIDSLQRWADGVEGETRHRRSAWATEDQVKRAFQAWMQVAHPDMTTRILAPEEWIAAYYADWLNFRWSLRYGGVLKDGEA